MDENFKKAFNIKFWRYLKLPVNIVGKWKEKMWKTVTFERRTDKRIWGRGRDDRPIASMQYFDILEFSQSEKDVQSLSPKYRCTRPISKVRRRVFWMDDWSFPCGLKINGRGLLILGIDCQMVGPRKKHLIWRLHQNRMGRHPFGLSKSGENKYAGLYFWNPDFN